MRVLWVMLACLVTTGALGQARTESAPAIAGTAQAPAGADSLRARLAQIPGLQQIHAREYAGVVVLSGQVLEARDRELAEKIAQQTPGVVQVDDRIELSTDLTQRLRPAWKQSLAKLQRILAALPLFLVALVIVALAIWIGNWLAARERFWGRRRLRNPFLTSLLRQAVRLAVVICGVLIALDLLDATTLVGAVLGAAGVAGLALGFAFKDIIENSIASVLLSLRQPFAPNDHVLIDGHEGKVITLSTRATVLMTLDGNHLRLPNAMVFKAVILNYTRNPNRRFDFAVGVGVNEDLLEAQQIGVRVLQDMRGVLDDPPPESLITDLGDSSVNIRYFGWVDQTQADFRRVNSEAIRLTKSALETAGMDLPEPIYRVQLSQPLQSANFGRPDKAKQSVRPTTQADVSIRDDVGEQVRRERADLPASDLLDSSAPRE